MRTVADEFIIDCSLTMAWFFVDEATAQTDALLERAKKSSVVVPSLWPLEVANVMLMSERRARVTQADTFEFIALLEGLGGEVDAQTPGHAFGQTLMLARAHALSTYDAAYLELALRRALPLASLDGDLIKAAQALGVPVL